MEHRDWAQASRLRAQVFDPHHAEHPQLAEEDFVDPAMNTPRWALSLRYGDGQLIIEGDPDEITAALEAAADLVHTARNTPKLFNRGYWAAERFYGPDARAALGFIAQDVADLRADFPRLPPQVEARISRIERRTSAHPADQPPPSS